jgi:hypothetical protein
LKAERRRRETQEASMSESLLKIVAVLFAAVALGATAAPTPGLAHGASSGVGPGVNPSSGLGPSINPSSSVGPGVNPSSGVGGHSAPAGVAGHSGSPSAPGKGALPTHARAAPRDPPPSGWKQPLGHSFQGQGGPGVVTKTCNPAYYHCGY